MSDMHRVKAGGLVYRAYLTEQGMEDELTAKCPCCNRTSTWRNIITGDRRLQKNFLLALPKVLIDAHWILITMPTTRGEVAACCVEHAKQFLSQKVRELGSDQASKISGYLPGRKSSGGKASEVPSSIQKEDEELTEAMINQGIYQEEADRTEFELAEESE